MIIEHFAQGSDEWFQARLGIPTGSQFARVITPSGKPSSQQDDFLDELVAQWRSGKVHKSYKSDAMEDGNAREPMARSRFSWDYDVEVDEVGMVFKDDDRLVACSPDGLFKEGDAWNYNHGLEIKSPIESTIIKYLRESVIPDVYKPQVYGSMWVTGIDRWMFMAYFEGYKPLYVEAPADDSYMKAFDVIMTNFIERMLERREHIKTYFE